MPPFGFRPVHAAARGARGRCPLDDRAGVGRAGNRDHAGAEEAVVEPVSHSRDTGALGWLFIRTERRRVRSRFEETCGAVAVAPLPSLCATQHGSVDRGNLSSASIRRARG